MDAGRAANNVGGFPTGLIYLLFPFSEIVRLNPEAALVMLKWTGNETILFGAFHIGSPIWR